MGNYGESIVSSERFINKWVYTNSIVTVANSSWNGYGNGMCLSIVNTVTVLHKSCLHSLQSTYQNDPQHLSSLVRRVMYQFIGPN